MEINRQLDRRKIMAYTVGLNNELDYGGTRIRNGVNTAYKAGKTIETIAEIAKLFA